jgi:hypothetical protein
MITISETIHRTELLEPTYVRYHVRPLATVRFTPVRFQPKRSRSFAPLVTGVYGTNRSPRDRMRHDHRWRQVKMPTLRYQEIQPRDAC